MRYPINSNISVEIISINEEKATLNASLRVTDQYKTVIEIYNVPHDLINQRSILNCVVAKQFDKTFISVFDAHIRQIKQSMQNDGTYSNSTVVLISTNVIIGDKPFNPKDTFLYFDLKVTDGCELIGLCPYDVNENRLYLAHNNKIDIPIDNRSIVAETTLGIWIFNVFPIHWFTRESLTFGFDQSIHFESKTPVSYKEFRTIFGKLTDLFEILCGELVTVNELTFNNGKYDENYSSYEFVGYTNYPLEKLRLLGGNGLDSTGFLRQSIFKVSDFENISTALNQWFILIEKISLANGAYQRILLDEDVKIITTNKFLASMQLVEGYISALSEKQQDVEKFYKYKSEIIQKMNEENDKEFLTKNCTYSGEIFRKVLRDFTFESISKLDEQSKSSFNKKYDKLIGKIKDERDIFTHSSAYRPPQYDTVQLADIAEIYKYFYRINVLSKLGIPPSLICNRLSHSRSFVSHIKSFFNIDLKSPDNELSEFDMQIYHFSQV